nr:FHA domain-containing protein [Pyxidicoccus fallax]
MKLIIEDDEGRKTVVPFVRDEITIGRQEGNTIRLTERNVSRRHARLVRLNGHVVVEDLGSYNGTRINGERIAGQSPLKEGDLIQIGDYDLALQAEGAVSAAAPAGPITTKVPARRPEMAKTEPALEAISGQGQEEEEDTSDDRASEEDSDGDEHDHTPPPSADVRRHSTSIIRMDQVEADRPRKVVDVPAEDAPRLVVLTPDELRGQEFACVRTELRIGRTDDNDITLDHRSLSRTHAKLVREETGEWRVIDMQSANGLTVNGESYAQATLGSGDILELGHVKLRFLNAGDAADDVQEEAGGGSRSKLPLVVVLAALLLGGGATAFYFLRMQPGATPGPAVAQPTEPAPEEPTAEPAKPSSGGEAVVRGSGALDVPKPPEVAAPPAVTPPNPELVKLGQQAIAARKFAEAEKHLTQATDSEGKYPAEVERLLTQAQAERLMEQKLADARAALGANKLDEAETLLRESDGTNAFGKERSELLAQLTEARKKAEAAAAAPPAAQNTVPANAAAPAEDPRVAEALAKGKAMRTTQPTQAIRHLNECIKLAPTNIECRLYLGSAYAFAEDWDKALPHFERFLELAPADHPRRESVIKLIKEYTPRPK